MVGVGENDIKNGEWLVEIKSKMVSAGKPRQCRATRDQLRPTSTLFHHAPARCGQGTPGLDRVGQHGGYGRPFVEVLLLASRNYYNNVVRLVNVSFQLIIHSIVCAIRCHSPSLMCPPHQFLRTSPMNHVRLARPSHSS